MKERKKHEKHRSEEEWIHLITRAYEEGPSDQAWCRNHDIVHATLRKARQRLLEKGKLDFLYEELQFPIPQESKTQGYLYLKERPDALVLILKPVKGKKKAESLVELLWFGYGLSYRQGQTFLFITESKKELLALKWRETGLCLFVRTKHQGSFPWPRLSDCGKNAMMTRGQFRQVFSALLEGMSGS